MTNKTNFSTYFIDILKKSDRVCVDKYGMTLCEKNRTPYYVMELIISLLEEGWQYFETIVLTLNQKYIPFRNSLLNLIYGSLTSRIGCSFASWGIEKGMEELYYNKDFVVYIYDIGNCTKERYLSLKNNLEKIEELRSMTINHIVNNSSEK